ncbi:methylmalonyl Co-A mutase-associated GTPase MeaB [Ignavibacterium sp.]|uniref:methylmalonyl Co-A mutase-associated GTPase MeaB n=1 Tax=Ignavibacterium sp. TaxID=2651167 RepID=UPI0021FADAC3|nr:methylmalonyl Co-A mutase-associated GTPase MeaB [Ignavibacterium sp.]BDQ02322.1 MAG: methylmalonyl Co-A mutase-associated GTPase MeaB [Ignavibacterium sp.]
MIDKNLVEQLLNSNRRAVARAISFIESDNNLTSEYLKELYNKVGNAYRIGITGPPGAGKSTITNQLTKFYRKQNKKVGIIAVDPTSPFTGGALLGDRVRMTDVGMDQGVFIRSMATRGSLGGLSKKAIDAADILDAAGFDIVILETVGVGQSELDIAQAADTTIVVLVPESGDSVQAMKAGLMEIADLFVLNKCDRPGSQQAYTALQTILMIKEHDENTWLPKIIKAVASENKGIEEIAEEVEKHKSFLIEKNLFQNKRQNQARIRIKEIVENKLKEKLWSEDRENLLNSSLQKVVLGNSSPYHIAEEILNQFVNKS